MRNSGRTVRPVSSLGSVPTRPPDPQLGEELLRLSSADNFRDLLTNRVSTVSGLGFPDPTLDALRARLVE
jgi:hypothetical protein